MCGREEFDWLKYGSWSRSKCTFNAGMSGTNHSIQQERVRKRYEGIPCIEDYLKAVLSIAGA